MDKLMSIPELSSQSGLKEAYLRKLIFERRLPFLKLGESRNALVRVRQSDFEKWLEANLQPSEDRSQV